jgi:hypothetical protein
MKWIFLISLFGAVLMMTIGISKPNDTKTYVITETSGPTSLDPLNADYTQNLPVARMIYATPIEVDHNDRLSSLVLDTFKYDPVASQLEWTVKKNIYYSTNQTITPDDIAFSIARMAYKRPKFPVIEHIVGLSEWIKKPNALESLPKGIKVNGHSITISFTQNVKHPLFRFSLEVFSIIPKSCVDLKTNEMICSNNIASGRFILESKTDTSIHFKRRPQFEDVSSDITFKYLPVARVLESLKSLDNQTIVAGTESMYSENVMRYLKEATKTLFMPASRFSILELNPDVGVFKDKLCRQIFADLFRRNYEILTGDKEGSIFTKITTGYMSSQDLEKPNLSKLTIEKANSCYSKLKTEGINWGYVESELNSNFVKTLLLVFKQIGIDSKPLLFKNRNDTMDAFVSGKISILNAGSGFWAYDPSGDLQMLFTPNLHKPLNFVTRDENFQALIRKVVNEPEDKSNYEQVNRYLHDEAIVNVYSHVRRFYFSTNKKALKVSQIGFSAPTPWQVFEL